MKVQHSVVISAPVELVFDFAANYENDPQWRSEVYQMRYTSGRPVSVGAQAVETSRVLGIRLETTTVVTEYEENRRVTSTSVSGPVPVVVSRNFEAAPGGTRFTYTLEGDVSGVLLFRLSQPILVRWYQKQLERYLLTLKNLLEATPALTSVTIRSAVEGDRAEIKALVRAARINPRNLDWRRFLVAEDRGRIVGVRQVRVHKNGTREVASGVVLPEYRRRNISADLMKAVLAREKGPLYLMCDAKWSQYYEQFGFHRVRPYGLPAAFRREYRIGRIVTTLLSIFARRKIRIIPMKREDYRSSFTHPDSEAQPQIASSRSQFASPAQ